MPPKKKKNQDQSSKKADQKKKAQKLADATFGLKNKKKSAKVQKFVQSTEKSIMNGGDQRARQEADKLKMAKAAKRAAKKAEEEERDALFGAALMAASKKTTGKKLAAKGRDAGDDEKKVKPGQSRAMKLMYQMDAQELADKNKDDPNYVYTLEDEIESKRQKMFSDLKKSGSKGTPVTEESLRQWQERKRKRKADAARKLVEAEMKKKKGGKGLSVLSGRDLYEYNKGLFVDDEAATDDKELVRDASGLNEEKG
eukprot:CAMPEP_0182465184 /NCGR_PEP_ID=MMETSP1319-20130603/9044_1 /TAXON_ID=172717 /ORGANISM="Bolidomonas pacifica, Strain RCC208" /LENGTH=254 /DNA_ID=CAMNT_0024664877 /DNA_START=195 /DNA_END=955 /DNA_ORIENTATION=-